MGYNTTVLILNDGLGDIRKNPEEFVRNLLDAIAERSMRSDRRVDVSCGSHANLASVVEHHHADTVSILAVGGNYVSTLGKYHFGNRGHHQDADKIELLTRLADKYGYRLVRKTE